MAVSKGVAGQRAGNTSTERNALFSVNGVMTFGGTIDSANAYDGGNTGYETEIRAGTILAMVTSTKLWLPCKRTTVLSGGGSVTTCVLTDARAFKNGDVIDINGDAITITGITYSTNTITWSGSTTIANGEAVTCVTSLPGSEIPRGILNEFIKLMDEDGVNRNKEFSQGVYGGAIRGSLVLGDLTACRAATNYLANITFASDIGQA